MTGNASEVITVHSGASSPHHASTQHAATSTVRAIPANRPARARRSDGLNDIYQKLKAEESIRLRGLDPTIMFEVAEILIDNKTITNITQNPEELVILKASVPLDRKRLRAGRSSADYASCSERH